MEAEINLFAPFGCNYLTALTCEYKFFDIKTKFPTLFFGGGVTSWILVFPAENPSPKSEK